MRHGSRACLLLIPTGAPKAFCIFMIVCGQVWDRGDMDKDDNRYSRLVAWLKILLPLASLAILSSVFLFSRDIDPRQASPFIELSVEDLAREQRVGAPNYAGVTDDGAAIYVQADTARPLVGSGGTRIETDGLNAMLERPDGAATRLQASSGLLDTRRRFARMSGGVQLNTSDGLHFSTDALIARLDRTDVRVRAIEGEMCGFNLRLAACRLRSRRI